MYSYSMYLKTQTDNPTYNRLRQNFGFVGKDAYVILNDGRPQCVYWENHTPTEYVADTLEGIAQLHVDAMNASLQTDTDA